MMGLNEFDQDALEAIAEVKAIERKTGARGLRSIIEEVMMNVNEIPSQEDVTRFVLPKKLLTMPASSSLETA